MTSANDRREREQRRKLRRAAISEISRRGYHATTVTDIIATGHVSRSTFYALYRGKEDCFLEAYRKIQDSLRAAVDQPLDESVRDFEQVILKALDMYLEVLFRDVASYQLFQQEIQVLGPAGVRARRQTYDAWVELILTRVQQAFQLSPALTRARRLPTRTTLLATLFGLNEIISRAIDSGEQAPSPTLRREILRMLASAFSPGAAEEAVNLERRFPYTGST